MHRYRDEMVLAAVPFPCSPVRRRRESPLMGWGEAHRPARPLMAETLLRDLAATGRTLAIEDDLGATVVEDRFLTALAQAEEWLAGPV